jgi:CDP-diacylglycerol--serine O-phosphatidyltransferase
MHLKSLYCATKNTTKKYKQSLFVIPYCFTFLNAFFGFLSLVKSFEGDYNSAAYYILLAAFMDAFDGRLARAIGSSSYLGMELDSLCDAVSFCLAPSILVYTLFNDSFGTLGLAVIGLYLCAGLLRLARFNTTSDSQQLNFIGLPTTMAAFLIASCVLYRPWIMAHPAKIFFHPIGLHISMLVIAFLMISPLQFPALKRYRIKFPYGYIQLASLIIVFSWLISCGYPLFVFILVGYIAWGIISSCVLEIKKRFFA